MAANTGTMTRGAFFANLVMTTLFFPALIIGLSGDLRWIEGWMFSAWMVAMILSTTVYMYLRDPALLTERTKAPGSDNQKTWDKYMIMGIYVVAVAWLILMPLDARRFGWSPAFPLWLKWIGGLMLIPALYLIFASTAQNTFLSTRVRIQSERKQRVISTGVYGFVRHPLYLGCFLLMFGGPLLLGSVIGLVIGVIALAGLVVRIIGEEKMLVDELEGYRDYQKQVGYRLIPLVW